MYLTLSLFAICLSTYLGIPIITSEIFPLHIQLYIIIIFIIDSQLQFSIKYTNVMVTLISLPELHLEWVKNFTLDQTTLYKLLENGSRTSFTPATEID